ncbi:MAG: acyl-CoA dehydrogenase family protein [Candidatus Cloacimonetes bacterium]|nr:acyl-CoA dehydrogenase family protein [Candidatus Cloacimonadota bacterium]
MSIIKFNNEQKMIQDEFRKFALNEIEPYVEEIEKKAAFPQKIVSKISELGLLSLIIPEKYGGVELDVTSLCIAVEELSKVSASIGMILVVNNCFVAYPLIKYGDESLKEKYLNRLSEGKIGGYICKSEIDLPEDIDHFDSQENSFSGVREFVLNGEAADFFIFPLSDYHYLIERNSENIDFKDQEILGIKAAGIKRLNFSRVKLTKEILLKPESKGDKIHSDIHNLANICSSAISLGIAQASLDSSIQYAGERIQFGKQISQFPMIREMLAEMKIRIETGRLLVYDAAEKFDRGLDFSMASKIAKIYSGETGVFCGLNSIQVFGGYGYMRDYPVERYFRDAKVMQLFETIPRELVADIALDLLGE